MGMSGVGMHRCKVGRSTSDTIASMVTYQRRGTLALFALAPALWLECAEGSDAAGSGRHGGGGGDGDGGGGASSSLSSSGGGAEGTESAKSSWSDDIDFGDDNDDHRYLSIEVRCVSGSACGAAAQWSLTVAGHT